MKISFIGFGNMAKAIAKGLLKDNSYTLRAAAPSLPIGVTKDGIETYPDNLAVIPGSDILVLAVKPAQMDAVLTQIHSKLAHDTLVISIAAGLSLSWFTKFLPRSPIVRAMPNVGAAVGKAATPLVANSCVNPTQKQWAEDLFTHLGIITWSSHESDIDIYTALSGSGPAYVFMFMEAMMNTAVTMGIAKDVAQSFTLQTFQGALNLAIESKLSMPELRHMVTSPKGSTAAAMEIFTQRGLASVIFDAMDAAYKRAQQLGSVG